MTVRFFTGLHQPSDARHFDAAFVSVNCLRKRKGPFAVGDWIMDSGAFTEVSTHGLYRHGVAEYAAEIRRWAKNGNLLAAVSQDWMCEPWIVAKTGLSVERHQQLTVVRYDALLGEDTAGVYKWERLVIDVCRPRSPVSFFHMGTQGHASQDSTIWRVVEWSKTTRGGKQYDLLHDEEPKACASAYGLCE